MIVKCLKRTFKDFHVVLLNISNKYLVIVLSKIINLFGYINVSFHYRTHKYLCQKRTNYKRKIQNIFKTLSILNYQCFVSCWQDLFCVLHSQTICFCKKKKTSLTLIFATWLVHSSRSPISNYLLISCLYCIIFPPVIVPILLKNIENYCLTNLLCDGVTLCLVVIVLI